MKCIVLFFVVLVFVYVCFVMCFFVLLCCFLFCLFNIVDVDGICDMVCLRRVCVLWQFVDVSEVCELSGDVYCMLMVVSDFVFVLVFVCEYSGDEVFDVDLVGVRMEFWCEDVGLLQSLVLKIVECLQWLKLGCVVYGDWFFGIGVDVSLNVWS